MCPGAVGVGKSSVAACLSLAFSASSTKVHPGHGEVKHIYMYISVPMTILPSEHVTCMACRLALLTWTSVVPAYLNFWVLRDRVLLTHSMDGYQSGTSYQYIVATKKQGKRQI